VIVIVMVIVTMLDYHYDNEQCLAPGFFGFGSAGLG